MYNQEEDTSLRFRQILENKNLSQDEIWNEYKLLGEQYEKLLGDTKFLTKVSDRLQNKMTTVNQHLLEKTQRLEDAQKIITHQYNELTKAKITLEEKVIERTNELKKAYDELLAANTELDNFVYRAAHDIRGPIARLLGICKLIDMEVTDPKALEFFTMINDNATQMNNLLSRLLYINNLKNSKPGYDKVTLKSTVDEAILSLGIYDKLKDVHFETIIFPTGNIELYTGKETLKILIESLLSYSVATMDNEAERKYLTFEAHLADKQLHIYIEYSGIEISNDDSPYIFDMLYKNQTDNSQLTGLELYSARVAAKKMHGHLTLVSSKKGETIFSVMLPLN